MNLECILIYKQLVSLNFKSLNYCILHLNGYRPMHMHLDLLLGDRLHVFGSYTL